MIQNIVLYLTSTAAQVWAAFMIFEVVVMREALNRRESHISDLRDRVRIYMDLLIWYLIRPGQGQNHLAELEKYGITRDNILRAEMDKKLFIQLMKALKAERTVMRAGQTHDFRPMGGAFLSSEAWQAKFDPIATSLEEVETKGPNVSFVFILGCIAILINLLAMTLSGVWSASEYALWFIVFIVMFVNVSMGFFAARDGYKAISN